MEVVRNHLPIYRWAMENRLVGEIKQLRQIARKRTLALDSETAGRRQRPVEPVVACRAGHPPHRRRSARISLSPKPT